MSLKKRIVLLLLIALLLCGCTAAPAEETQAEIPQTQPPEEEVITLYDADSEMEKATDSAVRAYALGEEGYTGLISVGDKVLLVTGTAASRFCMEAPVDAAVVAILDQEGK